MSTPIEWSPEDFAARLKERARTRRAHKPSVPLARLNFRRAAALVETFDPRTLRTPTGEKLGDAVLRLVEDCTSSGSGEVMRWKLRPAVRSAALSSFDSAADARRFLKVNIDQHPEPSTAQVALKLLRGDSPDLGGLDLDGLYRIREATSWLEKVPGVTGLPDQHEIDRLLEQSRLLEPLHALLRQPFEGRSAELAILEDHFGLIPAATWRDKLDRARRNVPGLRAQRRGDYPLVVHGPGGIGKSTLVAKSLLNHLTSKSVAQFPFVYVDAERATVRLNEPLSLVAEMAHQLAVEYPAESAAFTALSESARVIGREQRAQSEDLSDLKEVAATKLIGRAASHDYHAVAREADAKTTRQLGQILGRAVRPATPIPPLLVVLDSFEEAQYRASPVLDRMWTMFTALRSVYPHVRIVVAGRAPVGHPNVDPAAFPTLELSELDKAAAKAFLVQRGVGPVLAGAIVARIGGNPLSLTLAAKVVEASADLDDDDWINSVPAKRRSFFGTVDDMLIQGLLYDRLLAHITNPEVRKLAHPGLILRRITPDLIRCVLAPLCNVDVDDEDKAWQLFEEMSRELDMVERVASDVLVHRHDVRRVMLRLLASDKAQPVREVERRAIEYYAASDRPEDRAEEIYHRLHLGGDLKEVKTRWMPEIATHLSGAAAELSPRSSRLLTQLIADAPDFARSDDEQYEWEQRTAEEVENLLMQGYTDEALTLLDQRRPWTPCSPLHALLVEAQLREGEVDNARATLATALDAAEREPCDDIYLELLLLSASTAVRAGDTKSAEHDLDTAEHTATRLGKDLDALGVLLTRAKLNDGTGSAAHADAEEALIARVDSIAPDRLSTQPALVRAVAAAVGARAPRVLALALNLVGLPVLSGRGLNVLATAIVDAVGEPAVTEVLAELAADDPDRWTNPKVTDVERLLDSVATGGGLDEVAKHLLAINDKSGSLREGIAAAMAGSIPEERNPDA